MTKEKILVLGKEEDFAKGCMAVLNAQGYSCSYRIVDSQFSLEALIETLTKLNWPRLVVAQFRMSPYSAPALVRDLDKAALPISIEVAALADYDDDNDRHEFIRAGGAGFDVIDPGGVGLKRVLGNVLDQVASYRRNQGNRRREVVNYLRSITDEAKFRGFAIKLFRELGFCEVRETHGPDERGKDLVFYEKNRMGEIEFVGVQAKVGGLHGNVSRKGNVTAVWLQTVEALNGRVHKGGENHYLDKFVVLTSGEISSSARQKLADFLRPTKYDKRIYFFDQSKIADLVTEHARFLPLD